MAEDWAIGIVERPETEYQLIRYENYGRAAMNLAQLMAVAGPYNPDDMFKCMLFLIALEDISEESYNEEGKKITSLELSDVMFVIGKFEDIVNADNGPMTFRVVQDHRHCTPDHCFGDIAEMN